MGRPMRHDFTRPALLAAVAMLALAGCTTTGSQNYYRLKDGTRASTPATDPDFLRARTICDARAEDTAHLVTQRAMANTNIAVIYRDCMAAQGFATRE